MQNIVARVTSHVLLFGLFVLWPRLSSGLEMAFEVERSVEIFQTPGGYYRISAELGELPVSAIGTVNLKVANPFDHEIQLGEYFVGCACVKATLSDRILKPKSAATINLQLSTATQAISVDQLVSVTIGRSKDSPNDGVSLQLRYSLPTLIAFKDKRAIAYTNASAKRLDFRFELVLGSRIDASRVTVFGTGALKDVSAKVICEAGACYASGSVPLSAIPDIGLTGELVAKDAVSGISDSTVCTLLTKPSISFAPSPMILSWSEDKAAYTGSLFLQVNDISSETRIAVADVTVAGEISGGKIECHTTQLTNAVARTKVIILPDSSRQEFEHQERADGVIFVVGYKGKKEIVKVPILFKLVASSSPR